MRSCRCSNLSSAGTKKPSGQTLSSGNSFDPKEWGDYLIVKPDDSNRGEGLKLVRTIDVYARFGESTTLSRGRLLVQPFIDHSEDGYPIHYRVLNMFGCALYCVARR